MLATLIKRSGEQLDYDVNFEKWLTDTDTVQSATATVLPEGELEILAVNITSPIVKVWVSGGLDKGNYVILVTAETAGGRIKEVEFTIRIRD